jgi:hypothetical protein
MPNQDVTETFAVLHTADSKLDIARVGRLIAEPLGCALADLLPALAQRSGILAERLPEHIALHCIGLLTQAGIQAKMVPQAAIVDHPELVVLRSGRPDEDVFFYVGLERKGTFPWNSLLWIDLVSIQELAKEECDDLEFTAAGAGQLDAPRVRRVKSSRLVTKYPLFVDLVTSDPWLLLRIPQDRFDFAATGLPTFATRRENLIALAAVIASRALKAHLGPGMKWVESNTPPREHRLQSKPIYAGFLRWRLTCLTLAKKEVPANRGPDLTP